MMYEGLMKKSGEDLSLYFKDGFIGKQFLMY